MVELLSNSRLAESAGFRGVWLSEHRLWYDGYDATPLQTATRILARTRSLRVGTAVLLLPQHHPVEIADRAAQVGELSSGRLDLGVGLGYRNIEFDALGLERNTRGARMESSLTALWRRWSEISVEARPTLYVGAASQPALERAARHRAGLVLPGGWAPIVVQKAVEIYRTASGGSRPPDTAIVRHVWVTADSRVAGTVTNAVIRLLRDQYGGMAELEGGSELHPGSAEPLREVTVGSANQVIEMAESYRAVGVNHLIARIHNPYLPAPMVEDGIVSLADGVIEDLRT